MSIDPVEFGKLVEKVDGLIVAVDHLTQKVETQERGRNIGKGLLLGGVLVGAALGGGAGAAVLQAVERLL